LRGRLEALLERVELFARLVGRGVRARRLQEEEGRDLVVPFQALIAREVAELGRLARRDDRVPAHAPAALERVQLLDDRGAADGGRRDELRRAPGRDRSGA